LTTWNGWHARHPAAWRLRARKLLPVPLSPSKRTVVDALASRGTRRAMCRAAGESPGKAARPEETGPPSSRCPCRPSIMSDLNYRRYRTRRCEGEVLK
jgi:hypothetical protein